MWKVEMSPSKSKSNGREGEIAEIGPCSKVIEGQAAFHEFQIVEQASESDSLVSFRLLRTWAVFLGIRRLGWNVVVAWISSRSYQKLGEIPASSNVPSPQQKTLLCPSFVKRPFPDTTSGPPCPTSPFAPSHSPSSRSRHSQSRNRFHPLPSTLHTRCPSDP